MAEDVVVYALGLVHASVCSRLSIEETTALLNAKHPTGLGHGWAHTGDAFRDGTPSPGPCNTRDAARRHYLFTC